MISWEKREIIGKSGKVYKIVPESLSAGRTAEFEIRAMLLAYRTDFETLLKLLKKVKAALRDGRTFGEVHDALTDMDKFEEGMVNFQLNGRSELVEFCSLFCIADGEDVGVFTQEQIIDKWNDWKHIPEADFFLLCAKAIPSFKEKFLEILKVTGQSPSQQEQK